MTAVEAATAAATWPASGRAVPGATLACATAAWTRAAGTREAVPRWAGTRGWAGGTTGRLGKGSLVGTLDALRAIVQEPERNRRGSIP